MDQDGVAGLDAALPNDAPVAESGSVVGLQQAREMRFNPLTFVIGRIDVQGSPPFERLRFGTGRDPHGADRLPAGPVRVSQLEAALVFRASLEVEDAARKTIGDGVVEMLTCTEDALAADAHQWKRWVPCRFADASKLDRDRGVTIGIAADRPLETQVVQRRMLDREVAGSGAVLSVDGGGKQEKTGTADGISFHPDSRRIYGFSAWHSEQARTLDTRQQRLGRKSMLSY